MEADCNQTTPNLLVTGSWLQDHLADPAIRIIDARKCDGYNEAHIPGATKMPVQPFLRENGYVISPESFSKAMASMGITPETAVVVYDDGNSLFASRLWFVLNHYGHHNVTILNGGWDLWKAEGRPMESNTFQPVKSDFSADPEEGWIVDTDYVAHSLGRPDRAILDTRSNEEWSGEERTGETPAGHIPNAFHVFWSDVIDPASHRFRSPDELRKLFAEAGVTPDQEVITYCHAGIRAAHTFFALKLAGFKHVRNYEGSWLAWSATGQPVAYTTASTCLTTESCK